MASNCLGGPQVRAKGEVADKSSHCNSQHDPAIVRHEKQPEICQWTMQSHPSKILHYEEAVEDLHRVKECFDDGSFAGYRVSSLPPCPE